MFDAPSGSDHSRMTTEPRALSVSKALPPKLCSVPPESGAPAAPADTKSPSQVPARVAWVRLPELAAEEKYKAPAAVTVFTDCAINPSWNALSSK